MSFNFRKQSFLCWTAHFHANDFNRRNDNFNELIIEFCWLSFLYTDRIYILDEFFSSFFRTCNESLFKAIDWFPPRREGGIKANCQLTAYSFSSVPSSSERGSMRKALLNSTNLLRQQCWRRFSATFEWNFIFWFDFFVQNSFGLP